jgi:glutamate dehydrogenase/leucine dehydrogenase
MSNPFEWADDLGPEKVVYIHDAAAGLRAVVAIDNVAAGPSIGGVRMATDVSAQEAFRLARAMTLKNAAASLPHGGGKSVLFGDARMPDAQKESLVRAFAQAIADLSDYIPGPDMGTDERCMGWIRDEIGRAVGLPPEVGGIPLDEIGATGFGLAISAEVAKDFCGLELAGARVAVQGFGSVGRHAARFLSDRGASVVAVSDSGGTVQDASGLDVGRLVALKEAGHSVVDHDEANAALAKPSSTSTARSGSRPPAPTSSPLRTWIAFGPGSSSRAPTSRSRRRRSSDSTTRARWSSRTSLPTQAG